MRITFRSATIAALLCAWVFAPNALAQDDTALFSTADPPNVMLMVDNSGSMQHVVWHPSYDPAVDYNCAGSNHGGQWVHQSWPFVDVNFCGETRRLWADSRNPWVFYTGNYVDWIFSLPIGDPILAELDQTADGTYSPCVQALTGNVSYSKYTRTRATAAKDVLTEVVCNVNAAGEVRFGITQFRRFDTDHHGGYVRVPIRDMDDPPYTLNGVGPKIHMDHLGDAIDALAPLTWTPLAETLFQTYTYFMSRNPGEIPDGDTPGYKFPIYEYDTNFGPIPDGEHDPGDAPGDPVTSECQKHFVVIITDGFPTQDNFTKNGSGDAEAQGFEDFDELIGDFAPNYATEGGETGHKYLDDVALFMQTRDFRPDLPGMQVIDTYTVGFTTSQSANDLLQATADNGNGIFRTSNNAEELTQAITDAITDILIKSQTFSSATVPATRTAAGGNLYTSLFVPSDDTPFWEGHIKLWNLTGGGEILDANGNCAFQGSPVPCRSGDFSGGAIPFWDAGEEVPAPSARKLYTSVNAPAVPIAGTPWSARVDFDMANIGVTELGDPNDGGVDDLTVPDIATYSGSVAATVSDLTDEIVENIRGCAFGNQGVGCLQRPWLLGDIFHSNPALVESPPFGITEPSYIQFKQNFAYRDRVLFAGSNDGWIHGFDAGSYQPVPAPPTFDRGTGAELFGFMPWPVRQNIREIPRDTGARDYYGVDGSPRAADVWLYDDPLDANKDVDDWRTVLLGGLRHGGNSYYALDVTDPSKLGTNEYPGYLWEYPAEDPTLPEGLPAVKARFGETWGEPVIAKVKVKLGANTYERWVAVVTGGYAPDGDPNDMLNYDPNAETGRGIYIIDIKRGKLLAEKRFDPGAPDDRKDMRYAIASTPAVFDLDGDGFSDVIYVGDLGGNMWKWVIKYDPNTNPLLENHLVDVVNGGLPNDVSQPKTKFRRFFAAELTAGAGLQVTLSAVNYYKSFYFPPLGAIKSGKLWLTFGSGERADLKRPGDTSSFDENNRWYAMTDLDPYERRSVPYADLTEDDMADRTNNGNCVGISAPDRGYYFMADDHEKFITNAAIFNYWVIAGSFKPEIPVVDPCNSTGEAAIYIFKIYCGDGFFSNSGAGTDRKFDLGVGVPTDPKVSVGPGGPRIVVTHGGGAGDPPPPPMPDDPIIQLYMRQQNN